MLTQIHHAQGACVNLFANLELFAEVLRHVCQTASVLEQSDLPLSRLLAPPAIHVLQQLAVLGSILRKHRSWPKIAHLSPRDRCKLHVTLLQAIPADSCHSDRLMIIFSGLIVVIRVIVTLL